MANSGRECDGVRQHAKGVLNQKETKKSAEMVILLFALLAPASDVIPVLIGIQFELRGDGSASQLKEDAKPHARDVHPSNADFHRKFIANHAIKSRHQLSVPINSIRMRILELKSPKSL